MCCLCTSLRSCLSASQQGIPHPLSRPNRGARYRGRRLKLRCGCSSKKGLADPQWPERPQGAGLLGRQRRGWVGNWSGLPTTANTRAVAWSTKATASASLSTHPGCSAKGQCWHKASTDTAPAVLSTVSYSFIHKTIFPATLRSAGNRALLCSCKWACAAHHRLKSLRRMPGKVICRVRDLRGRGAWNSPG
eukprot:358113-Chlamydomonas_euryale.AAC.9